jgi:hypothetical protein
MNDEDTKPRITLVIAFGDTRDRSPLALGAG